MPGIRVSWRSHHRRKASTFGRLSSLAHGVADLARLAVDGGLDVVERADPLQRIPRDGAVRRLPDVMEVSPQVGPARRLADPRHTVGAGLVELLEAGIGVGLEDAVEVGQVRTGVLALVVG